jgi:hypothetical protein
MWFLGVKGGASGSKTQLLRRLGDEKASNISYCVARNTPWRDKSTFRHFKSLPCELVKL